MAYENAKRILKNEEMRVEQNDQSTYDDGIVIGFWEGIESKYLEECVEWLNHSDNDEVAADVNFFDVGFDTKLYHLHARFSEKDQRLYRILSKELNIAAPITQADTRWRIKSGGNHRGSNDIQILELPYCDPQVIEEIVKANTEFTYTNEIYTINGGILEGTWHNIKTIFEIDERTGRAKALWFLSKQANDDLHFAYQRNPFTFVVDFFKFDASETGLASLETDYYFDDEGNWYISTDGLSYTEKNGTSETGMLPTTIPASIVVSGAGTASYDNTYIYAGIYGGKPQYSLTGGITATKIIRYNGTSQWSLNDQFGDTGYVANDTSDLPPTDTWTEVGFSGANPAPTMAHSETSISPKLGTVRDSIDGRMVHPVEITRSESTRFYRAHVHIEFFDETTSGNSTSYGTPLVTVTETIVENASSLPNPAGTASYNEQGTKETDINVVSPQRDPIKGTWSYILQVIEKWAPHANQTNGAVGYVEGPSELRTKVESLALARGVGSGYASLGGWGGGGVGWIRHDSDIPEAVAKNFVPYNIALARRCVYRTSTRFYYYVKEPSINQYPELTTNQYPTDFKKPIEDKEASELDSSAPYLIGTQSIDDGSEMFGVNGQLVIHTYSDGVFTLIYYDSDDEVKFIRTYPAEGTLTAPTFTSSLATGGTRFTFSGADRFYPGQEIRVSGGSYEGTHTVVSITGTASLVVSTTYIDTSGGTVFEMWGDGTQDVDEVSLKAETTPNDDGLYTGHYIIDDTTDSERNFYTEAVRHRILKVADSVYALVIETVERTIWETDDTNKWILNAEEIDVGYARPPSSPSLAGVTDSNVPFVM